MDDDPFDELAKKWIDDFYVPKKVDVPETLYHYTDAAGLVGMLSNGKIWPTESRYLNDKSETREFLETAQKIVDDQIRQSPDGTSKELCKKIQHFQKIASSNFVFVFSLSSERDDLSQWRGYAHEGKGFTIGFSGRELCEFAAKDDFVGLSKVEYQSELQVKTIKLALMDFVKELDEKIDGAPEDREKLLVNAAKNFDWVVEGAAATYKHKSSKGENEWRLVDLAPQTAKRIAVRASGLRLVSYVPTDISVAKDARLPITSIGIGPGLDQIEQKFALEALCRSLGYQPELYFADSPYRSLG